MFIKICANTTLEDALLAAELGADAVGFVFAKSKRQVTAEQVAAITSHLPEIVSKVGVFTSTDADEILRAASVAGLTAVQLHSTFDPELVNAIKAGSAGMLRVIQVVDVTEETTADELRASLTAALNHSYVAAALIDASHGGSSGGTGKRFDWERTAQVVRQIEAKPHWMVLVAGGLNPENVAQAIATFAPSGVDVASGVEAFPGKKDPAKLKAFIEAARNSAATPTR